MSAISIAILLSIVVAIALGWKLNINIGLFAIVFAFVFGIFFLQGGSPNAIIDKWPTRLFFQLMTVTFFYAFATHNGTIEAIAQRMVYLSRNRPWFIPIALWLACFVLAGIGPGSLAMFMILPPIIMKVAEKTGLEPVMVTVIFGTGCNTGAWSPIAVNGIVTKSLIESAGYAPDVAAQIGLQVWGKMIIACIILFFICYFIFRAWRLKPSDAEKPAPFSREQKVNMILIAIMVALLVLPAMFEWMTGVPVFTTLRKSLDITWLAVLFSILCIIFRLGDFKKALSGVAWNTILLVCGTGMLIAVAADSGAMEYISTYIGENFAIGVVPYAVCIVAGVMSLFSSTMGVVLPTMYPLVYTIATVAGGNDSIPLAASLFAIIPIAAGFTGFSPFSTAGAMSMAACTDEAARSKLFYKLIVLAVGSLIYVLVLILAGLLR